MSWRRDGTIVVGGLITDEEVLEQAAEAKELAKEAFAECLDIVYEHAVEVAKGGPERHSDLPLSIMDILGKSGGSGSLN